MAIFREMAGNPIDNDADVVGVTLVDEVHEVFGTAETGGGGEIAGDLIAPGAVIGMFGDGEEFDVGVSQVFDVGDEFVGEFSVGEEASFGLLGDAHDFAAVGGMFGAGMEPGAGVQFVDGDGLVVGVSLTALLYPGLILPLVLVEVYDFGGGVGPDLLAKAVGVGFEVDVALGVFDFVFVEGSRRELGDKQFPNSGFGALHLVFATVPFVEVADDGDVTGVGRPDGKVNAGNAVDFCGVSAEFFVDAMVVAFGEEVAVEVGEFWGAEGVGVVENSLAIALFDFELIVFQFWGFNFAFKEVGMMDAVHGVAIPLFRANHPGSIGFGEVRSHDPGAFAVVVGESVRA